MSNKKRRQRGSRTHGGGSHKNRRGAGHRGGRAGSKKHEMHNYGPWAKHGFTQPEETQLTVAEVRVQKIDEDAALLAADGLAENEDGAYTLDARDVAEDGWEADVVKVLGNGQVRQELHVTADAFSDGAEELIEEAGGSTTVSERAEERAEWEAEDEAASDEASED